MNWFTRLFSRAQSTSSLPSPPAPGSAIKQTTTGDRNVTVGQVTAGGQVQVDQSKRTLAIDGDAQGPIIVGDGNIYNASPPVPGEPNPFGVPYIRNRYFAGREAVLEQLHQQLTQTGAAAMTQVQAISGLGGIGKTQTAVEYAYRYHYEQAAYETVFWVNADTEVTLASDYAAIAEQVAIPNAQALPQEAKIAAVRTWLNTHHQWLLIFDNADHPDWLPPWMPTNPNGKVLITSRASVFDQLSIQTPIALDVLSEPEALTLLFERTGIPRTETTEADARALNQALDGLPLALEQASAYIARQKIGFGPYLRAYGNQGLSQLEKTQAQTGRYPSSVLKTWQLNMAAVSAENPAATSLLTLSAFLAPDEIPFRILTVGADKLGAELADYLRGAESVPNDEEAIDIALRELLSLLSRYSLIRWAGDTDTYSLHRLVQAVVRDQLDPSTIAAWLTQVTAALNQADPGSAFEQWPQRRQFLPHWLRVIEQSLAVGQRSETLGLLCNKAGFFLKSQGRYGDAEPLYLEALAIRKAELGERHPSTATSLNNLAALYDLQGRYGEAEPLLIEALEIQKSELGERHLSTAMSLNNLAALYDSQGRYGDAEPLYLEALEIQKSELGERHLSTAMSLNNLAELYRSQGRYGEAEPLYLEALAIRKADLGERHPYTAMSLNNLAALYESQGRYGEAEPLYLEALEIWKAELGERHPSTARSLNNLAELYRSQGRYGDAEPLYLEALEISKAELGERHPDTARSLNNLALLYLSPGRYGDAEPLLIEALALRKAELGDRHPSTATSLNNLAVLYHQTKRHSKALTHIQQAIEIYTHTLGSEHPNTKAALSWLKPIQKALTEQP